MIVNKKFRRDTVLSYMFQAAAMAFNLGFNLLVAAKAGVELFGQLSLLVSLSGLLANLMTFRSNEAVIAFYKRGEEGNDWARCRTALGLGLMLDMLVGGTLVVILWMGADQIANHLLKQPQLAEVVYIYAGVLFIQLITSTPVAYLMAREWFVIVGVMSLLASAGKVLIVMTMFSTESQLGLEQLVIAILIPTSLVYGSALLGMIGQVFLRMRAFPFCRETSFYKEYLRFSASTFLSSTVKAATQNIDTVVLGYVSGSTSVGMYGLIKQFTSVFSFLSAPLSLLAYPKFISAVERGRRSDINSAIAFVNKRLLLVFLPLALAMYGAFTWYLNSIDQYAGLVENASFALVLFSTCIGAMMWWSRPFANAVDPDMSLSAGLLGAIISLILIIPLTYLYAAAGTALAMCAVAVATHIYFMSKLKKYYSAG
jgi:O-antigen/teichoic acid export membrane protein